MQLSMTCDVHFAYCILESPDSSQSGPRRFIPRVNEASTLGISHPPLSEEWEESGC